MKKNIVFLAVLICLFGGCDKIEEPIQLDDNKVKPLSMAQFDSIAGTLDLSTLYRKFLFEEFTGTRCTNCPDGHREVRDLRTNFGDTMVAIGIHAGFNAEPNDAYPYEFRVEEGKQLYVDFGGFYTPIAVLNRAPYDGNDVKIPRSSGGVWKTAIQQRDKTMYAAIQIINQYDDQRQALVTNAKITMLQDYPNSLSVVFYIIENKILKPQLDHGVFIPNYEHNHVLRGSMNGIYGKPLNDTGTLAKDASSLMAYRTSFYGKDWVKENCQVIVFLRDNTTGVVLQVEKAGVVGE
jgi:hypothetical protein